eukprot:969747-Rhodomonas_salina.2
MELATYDIDRLVDLRDSQRQRCGQLFKLVIITSVVIGWLYQVPLFFDADACGLGHPLPLCIRHQCEFEG